MDDRERALAAEVARLAATLPQPLVEGLAAAVGPCEPCDWPSIRSRGLRTIPHPHYRDLVARFFDSWAGHAGTVTPQAVALALRTAARTEQAHRDHQTSELVWTGPPTDVAPLRRTEQAILQVVGAACRSVLVVSYAVYNIPRIAEALVTAADRGVTLTVVLESPDPDAGKGAYDTLRALGRTVAARSRVYLWPIDRRPRDPNGRRGILHVKCVVADARWLFLSSANLTEYAFTVNMELGVLVTGGQHPLLVERLFQRMIESGTLELVVQDD